MSFIVVWGKKSRTFREGKAFVVSGIVVILGNGFDFWK